eukprot:RCo048132
METSSSQPSGQSITKFRQWLEKYVALPEDSELLRGQKVFLAMSLWGSLWWCLLLLAFSVLDCVLQGFPPASVVYVVISVVFSVSFSCSLASLVRTKQHKWPRRVLLGLLWVAVPVTLAANGGFEFFNSLCALTAYHVFLCVSLYDSYVVPLAWTCLTCTLCLVWGVADATVGPITRYTYPRTLRVAENCTFSVISCGVFFFCAWYMLSSLRLEVVERKNAEARAVAATEAKASFLACMSHELRSPLNGVIGLSEVLRSTPLSRSQRGYVNSIGSCAKALLSVLNDILTFSKLEASRVTLEHRRFNLRECVEEVVAMVGSDLDDKRVELIMDIPHIITTWVTGDEARLSQVLLNLLSNAKKFTASGTVTVRVEQLFDSAEEAALGLNVVPNSADPAPLETSSNVRSSMCFRALSNLTTPFEVPSRSFLFQVQDTGIGLAPEQIPRLFQPFTQADLSTTRKFGGTGLGLTICKQLVNLWGGKLSVSSEGLGHGSTFFFSYPMLCSGDDGLLPGARSVLGSRAAVVDYLPARRRATEELLLCFFSSVVVAEDLDTLQEEADRNGPPTLVLLFVSAEQSGWAVLRPQIRHMMASSLFSPATVMGYASVPALQEAQQYLGFEFYPKPPTSTQIRAFLESRQAQPSALECASSSEFVPAPSRSIRALVAEDIAVNQVVISQMLKQWNISADVANNGAEAVELCQERIYELILMDCHMPILDGYEASQRIRKLTGYAEVPIIALTAATLEEDQARCFSSGMSHFLAKPVTVASLASVLQAAEVI